MPNGKYGDHPINDLIEHKAHPFPCDIEALILKLNEVDRSSLDKFEMEPFDWARRINLKQGRSRLHSLLIARGYNASIISLKGRISHSFYLISAVLLLSSGFYLWNLIYNETLILTKEFQKLDWTMPLAPTVLGLVLLIRWIKNR